MDIREILGLVKQSFLELRNYAILGLILAVIIGTVIGVFVIEQESDVAYEQQQLVIHDIKLRYQDIYEKEYLNYELTEEEFVQQVLQEMASRSPNFYETPVETERTPVDQEIDLTQIPAEQDQANQENQQNRESVENNNRQQDNETPIPETNTANSNVPEEVLNPESTPSLEDQPLITPDLSNQQGEDNN